MTVKTFDTSYGLVAFKDYGAYLEEGLLTGSMGSVAKETGAKLVMLLGPEQPLETLTQERAEELAGSVMRSASEAKTLEA